MTNFRNPAALAALADGDIENAMVAATPGGIEAQEAAGQQALVASENMPKEMRPDRAAYEKLGFVFGDDVDDIFVSATLPKGWKKQATEHSMHSDILDEKGRKRAGIFYKAAFYDRSASCNLSIRYSAGVDYSRCDDGVYYVAAFDQGKPFREFGSEPKGDYDAQQKLESEAHDWLAKEYPEHRNPLAYW